MILEKALIEDGEAVYRIVIQSGRVTLERASAWTISGSPWFYHLEIPSPNGQSLSYVSSAEGVLHPRMNVTSLEPWKGRGANAIAGQTASLLASLERLMSNELVRWQWLHYSNASKINAFAIKRVERSCEKIKGWFSLCS